MHTTTKPHILNRLIWERCSRYYETINYFPNSKYAKDSQQKIILVKSNIAAKHMSIGRFYQENDKFIAALNRFKIVVDDFSVTKFTPEALHRMVEIYYKLGMKDEAIHKFELVYNNHIDSRLIPQIIKILQTIDPNRSDY